MVKKSTDPLCAWVYGGGFDDFCPPLPISPASHVVQREKRVSAIAATISSSGNSFFFKSKLVRSAFCRCLLLGLNAVFRFFLIFFYRAWAILDSSIFSCPCCVTRGRSSLQMAPIGHGGDTADSCCCNSTHLILACNRDRKSEGRCR